MHIVLPTILQTVAVVSVKPVVAAIATPQRQLPNSLDPLSILVQLAAHCPCPVLCETAKNMLANKLVHNYTALHNLTKVFVVGYSGGNLLPSLFHAWWMLRHQFQTLACHKKFNPIKFFRLQILYHVKNALCMILCCVCTCTIYVTVLDRNRILFHRVFRAHHQVWRAIALSFH